MSAGVPAPGAPVPAVSAAAAALLRRMLGVAPAAGAAVRVTLQRVGCSSAWQATVRVEAASRPGDREFDVGGVRLRLAATSALLHAGVALDADEARGGGLVVVDPRPRGCHCGAHAPRR